MISWAHSYLWRDRRVQVVRAEASRVRVKWHEDGQRTRYAWVVPAELSDPQPLEFGRVS